MSEDDRRELHLGDQSQCRCDVSGLYDSRAGILEDDRHELTRVTLVVDHQHRCALQRRARLGHRLADFGVRDVGDRRRERLDRASRQDDLEGGTAPFSLATRGDDASVELDEVSDDGETQAEAAVVSCGRRITLTESVEHVRQEARG